MSSNPTFDDIHAAAHECLDFAEDWLHVDFQPGTGPTDIRALGEARGHIALAKAALDRATAHDYAQEVNR